jgi:hypothetical protein
LRVDCQKQVVVGFASRGKKEATVRKQAKSPRSRGSGGRVACMYQYLQMQPV